MKNIAERLYDDVMNAIDDANIIAKHINGNRYEAQCIISISIPDDSYHYVEDEMAAFVTKIDNEHDEIKPYMYKLDNGNTLVLYCEGGKAASARRAVVYDKPVFYFEIENNGAIILQLSGELDMTTRNKRNINFTNIVYNNSQKDDIVIKSNLFN